VTVAPSIFLSLMVALRICTPTGAAAAAPAISRDRAAVKTVFVKRNFM
jgi:hypothetical protein